VFADGVDRAHLRLARGAATEAAAVDLSAPLKRVPPPDEQQHERAVKELTGKIDDLNKQQVRPAAAFCSETGPSRGVEPGATYRVVRVAVRGPLGGDPRQDPRCRQHQRKL